MSEKNKTIIYEHIGLVKCSPPALEYKSDECEDRANYVCHHCKSPLCSNCVEIEPDEKFPVFTEETKLTKSTLLFWVLFMGVALLITIGIISILRQHQVHK